VIADMRLRSLTWPGPGWSGTSTDLKSTFCAAEKINRFSMESPSPS